MKNQNLHSDYLILKNQDLQSDLNTKNYFHSDFGSLKMKNQDLYSDFSLKTKNQESA